MRVPGFEFLRKGYHMVTGIILIPLVVYTSLEYATLVALAALVIIVVTEALHQGWGIRLPFVADQLARTRRSGEAFSFASVSFLVVVVGLLWLTPLPVAFAASALLALGDGCSALVGRAIGRHPIPYSPRKTWEGSVAGLVAGAAGAFAILAWYFAVATTAPFSAGPVGLVCVVGALVAMVAESLPRFEDNLTVPLLGGAAMAALWWGLGMDPARPALASLLMGP